MSAATITRQPQVWHLVHSGHQVAVLNHSYFTLSAKLTKQAANRKSERASEIGAEAFVPFAQIPLPEVVSISANNVTRTVRIEIPGKQYEVRGLSPKNSTITTRMGSSEKHDPRSPGSPTQEAAEQIALASGLVLKSDPRAEILHYELPGCPETRFEALPGMTQDLGTVRIRPWKSVLLYLAILAWMVAWSPTIGSSLPGPQLWATGLQAALIALVMILSLKKFLGGIVVGPEGITGFGHRRKLLPWTQISLLHVHVEEGDMLGRSSVVAITNDDKSLSSDYLSMRQANRVAEALVRFGTPWDVKSSVYARDFSKKAPKGVKLVRSPIAEISSK